MLGHRFVQVPLRGGEMATLAASQGKGLFCPSSDPVTATEMGLPLGTCTAQVF